MSMEGNGRSRAVLEKLWQDFDESEKEIVFYLANASPPISIDALE